MSHENPAQHVPFDGGDAGPDSRPQGLEGLWGEHGILPPGDSPKSCDRRENKPRRILQNDIPEAGKLEEAVKKRRELYMLKKGETYSKIESCPCGGFKQDGDIVKKHAKGCPMPIFPFYFLTVKKLSIKPGRK